MDWSRPKDTLILHRWSVSYRCSSSTPMQCSGCPTPGRTSSNQQQCSQLSSAGHAQCACLWFWLWGPRQASKSPLMSLFPRRSMLHIGYGPLAKPCYEQQACHLLYVSPVVHNLYYVSHIVQLLHIESAIAIPLLGFPIIGSYESWLWLAQAIRNVLTFYVVFCRLGLHVGGNVYGLARPILQPVLALVPTK